MKVIGFTDPDTKTFITKGIRLKWVGPVRASCDFADSVVVGKDKILGKHRSGRTQSFLTLEALQTAYGSAEAEFWHCWSFFAWDGWCYMASAKGHHVIFSDPDKPRLAYINRQSDPLPGYELVNELHHHAYRHPEQPNLVWFGRGRRPHWLRDLLAEGAELNDLLCGNRTDQNPT